MLDFECNSSHTTQNLQSLNICFSANPRVNGTIGYERNQYNDELGGTLSSERERIQADIRYTMPRGAGDYYGGFTQELQHEPLNDNSGVNSGLRAGVNFNLDKAQRSRLQIFMEQQNSSSQSGRFGIPRSSDAVTSGFAYSLVSPQGLGLNARWSQILRETQPSANSSNTQQLNLTLNYDTPAGWRYQLNIRSNDYSQDSLLGGTREYRTEDSIQALLSYSF
jgi:hypothetical protein